MLPWPGLNTQFIQARWLASAVTQHAMLLSPVIQHNPGHCFPAFRLYNCKVFLGEIPAYFSRIPLHGTTGLHVFYLFTYLIIGFSPYWFRVSLYMVGLELFSVDQVDLELTQWTLLLLPPNAGIKDMCYHASLGSHLFTDSNCPLNISKERFYNAKQMNSYHFA